MTRVMQSQVLSFPLSSAQPDWGELATTYVEDGEKVLLIGRRESVDQHLLELEWEFRGDPRLHYYHAALSVCIRRDIQRDLALQQFHSMWSEQEQCLLRVSLRWLISACDTLMEHGADLSDRTAGALGSVLGNTVKLYETERHFSEATFAPKTNTSSPVPLFDGLTTFSIGYGDMIRNQRQRLADLAHAGGYAHRIVSEIIARLDANDTIFARFAALHEQDATRWWS